MKTLVIGSGRMGRRHIQVVKDLNLEIDGVLDFSQDVLNITQEEHNIPSDRLFTSVDEAFNNTSAELVIISTTAPFHLEYVEKAAEYGAKYILCEKPMATSIEDCNRILEICDKNNIKLAINHQMRFMEQYTLTKELVQSEAFGGLSSVTVVAGNFGMSMNGTHYFEMFRYMTDELPDTVQAWFDEDSVPNPRGERYQDRSGSIRVVTASGKRFYMEISADQGHGMHVTYTGPNGRITIDELLGKMTAVIRDEEYRELPTTRYGMPATETLSQIEPADAVSPTKSVLKALLNDEDYPDGVIGRAAVATLVAAYESNENDHKPVKVDMNLPADRDFPWA